MIPSAFYSFHLISFTRISRGQSHHKSGSLNNKYEYHSTSQSTARKITCQCTSLFHHLVRATPKTNRKPFQGHGRLWWPRPPWPLQRSAARPRRRRLSQPRDAAPSGLGRRGCDAEGGQLRLPWRNEAYSHGMFLRVVGQKFLDRS